MRYRPLSLPLLLAAFLTFAGGCVDSSKEPASTVDSFVPPAGLPFADGNSRFVPSDDIFTLQEDTSISAQLVYRDTPPTNADDTASQLIASPEFVITQEPGHGQVALDASTGRFEYIPNSDFFGTDSFRFYVVADGLGSNEATVSLAVTGINDAPVLTGDIVTVIAQGALFSTELQAVDVDNDTLVFTRQNFPDWLMFDAGTLVLFGTPAQMDAGIHENISLTAADPSGEIATIGPFSIEVIDINDSPTVNPEQFPEFLDARERVEVNLFPDDPDGDFVTIEAELNDFVAVEILGGSIAVTAKDVSEVTVINLVVIATDRLGSAARTIIPLTLYPVTESGLGRTLMGRRSGAGMHLVVLGDGYKADEQNSFDDDVGALIDLMRQDISIATHLSGWNIHAIHKASVDSGIDDNVLQDFRQTAFDSGYFCRGIQRLICANEAKVFGAALDEYPSLDQIVLLVNDPRYGGSGGSIAIAAARAPEIALHEMGHSIAQLADEYVDSLIPSVTASGFTEGRFANVSSNNLPGNVPWSRWIDDPVDYPFLDGQFGVGIFEGAYFQETGFYRPTSTSRMRDNEKPFGVVNGEQWILSIYQRTNPVIDFAPVLQRIELLSGQSQSFSVVPLFKNDVQSVAWYFNGEELVESRDNPLLNLAPGVGEHELNLVVSDATGRIRVQPPHPGHFRWTWQLSVR